MPDFFKKNVFRAGIKGALIGLALATIALAIPLMAGWHETHTLAPFIVLSMMIFGFCTWEGGMIGLHNINERFARYKKPVESGAHLLAVDIDDSEEVVVQNTVKMHPKLHRVHITA